MNVFKTWGIMAAAAVMLSAGVGIAGAINQEEPTHYNVRPLTDLDQTPIWEPITPTEGNLNCSKNDERECKAIQRGPNDFEVVQTGNYPGL